MGGVRPMHRRGPPTRMSNPWMDSSQSIHGTLFVNGWIHVRQWMDRIASMDGSQPIHGWTAANPSIDMPAPPRTCDRPFPAQARMQSAARAPLRRRSFSAVFQLAGESISVPSWHNYGRRNALGILHKIIHKSFTNHSRVLAPGRPKTGNHSHST